MVVAHALALLFARGAAPGADHRQQLVLVELLGRVEARPHHAIRRLLAAREHVEEVADPHHLAELEVLHVLDQQLHEQLDRGALPLEGVAQRDERLHERGAERVELAERLRRLAREEGVPAPRRLALELRERVVELLLRRGVLGAEDPLLHDGREVAVLEHHGVEAALPVLERVVQARALGPHQLLAHHLGQVALPGDEAHQRHGPLRLLRLDQLHHLLHLVVQPGVLARAMGQPEDELVEEEHDAVVAELLRVARHHREPVVDVDVGAHAVGGLEARLGQGREELLARRRVGALHRGLEARPVPALALGDLAPAVVLPSSGRALVHGREEALLAQLVQQLRRVGEELLVGEEAGQHRVRVRLLHEAHVLAEDRALEVLLADHVEVQLEQLRLADERVPLADAVQLGLGPRRVVPAEQEAQQRHEVRLAAAEAPVQIRRLALAIAQRAPHQLQRPVERLQQGGGDDEVLGEDELELDED